MAFDPDLAPRRLPVWRALSELFLDTDLRDADYDGIAAAIAESGLEVPEVEAILWNEVLPALGPNLQSPAGIWSGFDDASLARRILAVAKNEEPGMGRLGMVSAAAVRSLVEKDWTEVRTRLDSPARSPHDAP